MPFYFYFFGAKEGKRCGLGQKLEYCGLSIHTHQLDFYFIVHNKFSVFCSEMHVFLGGSQESGFFS